MKQFIKIIEVDAVNRQFADLLPGTVHEVVEPPRDKAEDFPNCKNFVWVMGDTRPVRIFTAGRRREAIILPQSAGRHCWGPADHYSDPVEQCRHCGILRDPTMHRIKYYYADGGAKTRAGICTKNPKRHDI